VIRRYGTLGVMVAVVPCCARLAKAGRILQAVDKYQKIEGARQGHLGTYKDLVRQERGESVERLRHVPQSSTAVIPSSSSRARYRRG
jgi:hypothetical protein